MDNPRPSYVAGNLAEYLGVTAGKVNDSPVGILTFRPHVTSPQPVNLMISNAFHQQVIVQKPATIEFDEDVFSFTESTQDGTPCQFFCENVTSG
jgi:hypothetical protein